LHIGTNLEGVAKLSRPLKEWDFLARQFALWVIPVIWWEAEEEPDISEEPIQVCFR
jgi:hypothetical protein